MFDNRSNSRNGNRDSRRGGDPNEDVPPMSRLFIICNKAHREEDFREAFSRFGHIEDIWVVKDRHTGENKGITYIKFSKTTEAARAQEEMNGKTIGSLDRTLKVLVASNRNQGSSKSENEHEKYVRLFIVCPKSATEEDLRDEFSQWAPVENVTLVRDKQSGNSKGFAYIRFSKFYDAAVAFENCPAHYKAMFAEPKGSTTRNRDQYSGRDDSMMGGRGVGNMGGGGGGSGFGGGNMGSFPQMGGVGGNFNNGFNDWGNNSFNNNMSQFMGMQNTAVSQPTCLEVIVSNCVNQDQLWRLFDIIPGLDYCQIVREHDPRTNEALVVYDNPEAAVYAKDKLHGLEYPIGERLIIQISGMSGGNHIDTSFIDRRPKKDSICNVPLPDAQPLAPFDAPVAQRLFIVLAANLPISILKNVFSCWRGLIDVYLLPNKNCGYVKYADRDSAQSAMRVLHGAEICGTKIKVLKAEERGNGDDDDGRKRMRRN
ncbi:RNA-binding protein 45-like [Musca autumnalis]|uniref:RNA-binding protein 45-like n=1 Tax=Musca autumnalis TaxID=221902 RepID=UPI003CF3E55B